MQAIAEEEENDVALVGKQRRLLLFMRHCARCRQSERDCSLAARCTFGKQLWSHLMHCANTECAYPCCFTTKHLLRHHHGCMVCI